MSKPEAPEPTGLDVATAVWLVSKGRANSEQQKLAHKHYRELIEEAKDAAKRPVKQNKMLETNLLTHQLLMYQKNNQAELKGEGEGDELVKSVYIDVGESRGISPETVKREYRKWKNSLTIEELEEQVEKYNARFLELALEALENLRL
ncbi:MAG: hypothetical protein KBT87_02160 [Gammaproteobacteria bacterium]|nr:hypothetical protein [Gammaproteobacteria bacterium]MBQ0773455.1 hypothetical protein [Gammaproteobacteria bacterium]